MCLHFVLLLCHLIAFRNPSLIGIGKSGLGQADSGGADTSSMIYTEDLGPGEVFGELALKGASVHTIAVYSISECDLATIECVDFQAAMLDGARSMSVDDKVQFLEQVWYMAWHGI